MQVIRNDGSATPLLTGALISLSALFLLDWVATKPYPNYPRPKPVPRPRGFVSNLMNLALKGTSKPPSVSSPLSQGEEVESKPYPVPPIPRHDVMVLILGLLSLGVLVRELGSPFELRRLPEGKDAAQGITPQ